MTSKTTLLAGALVTGVLALTGCSDDSVASHMDSMDRSAQSTGTSADEDAAFNDADVTFAQGMIPHHEQAIEMAQMASERAQDPRVLDLASRIEAAQQPEIDTLTGWLEEWGVEGDGRGGMDHGGMGGMGGIDHGGGMMSEEDMNALMAASGAAFDRLFLEQMIEHHTGAVEMAVTESAEGRNRDAVAMAEMIRDTQTDEIAEMRQLLTELGG
ncbi:DUF305 domain-containing protein [Blastococcus sp. PRF04-17]|uniref:DUF305 domain-containing protein n=1 Tax=Blastococcus sp. PRF04-17 TaxID=2933797 RepID=UPI001FF5A709|nr:DUF305 domain-containing protein [Blastococcus sp. PRF04-17]UOY00141.1 DUF305 domain-containing protein [Blastococcus sp. PRF04-17]